MSTVYQRILATREDMTEWLIHFTRPRGDAPAVRVLANMLAPGFLKPSWSVRDGKPTIYGPQPAVCFTEQPINAFLAYVRAREGNTHAPSGHGVVVHKHDAFADGALPVIYGVASSSELQEGEPHYDPHCRQLNPECLPLMEQYRFVTFAPTRQPYPIDWSHEREWRWSPGVGRGPAVGRERRRMFALGGSGAVGSNGMSEGRCRAVVRHDEEIPKLQDEVASILGKLKTTDEDLEFYWGRWRKRLREKVRVLSLETAERELNKGRRGYARLETFPDADLHPVVP